MLQASPGREFIRYSCFSVLGMLGISLYILADTYFISKSLGANGLAALNLALPVYNLIHGSGLMLGMGGGTKYAIWQSQNQEERAKETLGNTLALAGLFSLIFVGLGLVFSQNLTALLGADEAVFADAHTYLKVLLLFAPAFIFNDVLLSFVRNDGSPGLSMTAMLVGSVSNIVLDYVFMFPMGMGMFGAVFATGLSAGISMLWVLPHWFGNRAGCALCLGRLSRQTALQNLSLGFPSLVEQLSSGVVLLTFNFIILHLQGNTGVAAYGVIANLSLVASAVYAGLAQGVQPLISRAYGHGDLPRGRRLLRYALCTMAAIALGIYLAVSLFTQPITAIFNSQANQQLQDIACSGLTLYFLCGPFLGYNIIVSVFFTSTQTPLPAHIISLLRGLVLIVPMAFILSAVGGMTGVWLAVPITELLVAAFGAWAYFRHKRTIDALI